MYIIAESMLCPLQSVHQTKKDQERTSEYISAFQRSSVLA